MLAATGDSTGEVAFPGAANGAGVEVSLSADATGRELVPC
jgi:hypothetical protein